MHLPALSTPADPAIDAGPDGKVRVSITHSKLTEPAAVEHWKAFWGEWLQALQEEADDDGT